MVNKKIWLKTILFVGSMVGFSLSFASTAWFNISLGSESIQAIDANAIRNNMMPVHFVDNGNDFGGFIYNSTGSDFEEGDSVLHIGNHYGESVSFEGGSRYVCKHRVKGFYYNSERGERLFPIDEETASIWHDVQPGLMTDGGLYTECMSEGLENALMFCESGSEDGECDEEEECDIYDESQCEVDAKAAYGFNGYYGMVTHVYSGKNFGLIVGAQYSEDDSTWLAVNNSGLAETFIRYDNKYPVGLIYDYHGGVGFVGCEFTDNKTIGLRNLVNSLNNGTSLSEMFEETGGNIIQYIGNAEGVTLNCDNVGMVTNSLIEIVIEGLVGMGKESDLAVIGNQSNPKMQFFKSVNVNNATLVNYARKKAETLCRGKWINYDQWYDGVVPGLSTYKQHMDRLYIDGKISNYESKPNTWQEWIQLKKIISFGGAWQKTKDRYLGRYSGWYSDFRKKGRLYCIDLTNEEINKKTIVAEPGYTYVVKAGNVVVTPMLDLSHDDYYYDVYILGSGNLLLDSVGKNDKRVISTEGFIDYKCLDDSCEDATTYIDNYKNGIVPGESYRGKDVAVGAIIKGNFVVDGHLKPIGAVESEFHEEDDKRISNRYFIYGKLTTKDSISDLEDLFSWGCNLGMSSDSDEEYCPLSIRGEWTNPYENAPLVIIDQNYDSPIYG